MMILVLIIGIIFGSFLNVCIYRIPRKESIAFGASHCTKCGNRIKWYDLVPILSYLILKGRCRYCKENISLQYPFIEFLNGIAYLALYYLVGLNVWFYFACALFSIILVLIGIFFTQKINKFNK